jgi:hypothetical protein
LPASPSDRVKFEFRIKNSLMMRSWRYGGGGGVSSNFEYLINWEGCMGSMQCNVEFGYQLSICPGTTENLNQVGRSQDLPDAN